MSWQRRDRQLRLAQQRRKRMLAEAQADGRLPTEVVKVERHIQQLQQAGGVQHG